MLFDSLPFLLFLPVVIILYYLTPHKYRWLLLLCASYFFYGSWKAEFLILIVYSTIVDYLVAIKISNAVEKVKKRAWLAISLISNFSVLFVFKYFNFFIGSRGFFQDLADSNAAAGWLSDVLEYGIPVGISFYTFQTVGYTIDVYQGKADPEKHVGKFALFVSYFPQLVAGPIERFGNLHKQILAKHKLTYDNLSAGFRMIVYGLFIKMVIADNIAPYADQVFDNPLMFSQGDNIIALILFSVQIYADFHGYSLIAIGVAKIMGVNLMDNFRTPYFATSIKDFWSRWHISLSTWFRDYLYLPLGGNRVKYFRWMINILIVFVVSGIWHGANFTFIIWGGIHGVMYLSEQMFVKAGILKAKNTVISSLGFVKTLVVINVAWLFFRSDTLCKAYLSICKMTGIEVDTNRYYTIQSYEHSKSHEGIDSMLLEGAQKSSELGIETKLLVVLGIFLILELFIQKSRFDLIMSKLNLPMRWSIYAVLIFCIMALSGANFYQFIYFQF